MIPIYKPYLKSLENAHKALDSSWISSNGYYIDKAQELLKNKLNSKYIILTNNGTTATHLIARVLYDLYNINTIITSNSLYVAAWNCFLYDKNFKLKITDVDIETWNWNEQSLKEKIAQNPGAALLAVHNVGNIINVPKIRNEYSNIIVEDNCEGFCGYYSGFNTGIKSLISSISFFGNKNITCGEGGAVITQDENIYKYVFNLKGQGQSDKRYIHNNLGYNYRMTNIQAAILCDQLEILPEILEKKCSIFDRYRRGFKDREDIILQKLTTDTQSSNWMFALRIPGLSSYSIIEKYLNSKNIDSRPMFYPISYHSHLKNNSYIELSSEVVSEILSKECFMIPSYPELSTIEVDYIIKTINDFVKNK